MESSESTGNAPPDLWEYVPLGDYKVPADTVEHQIRSGIGSLWKKFKAEESPPEAPVQADEDLRELSRAQMHGVAPEPDWTAAIESLDTRFEAWLADEIPAEPVAFMVLPPHSWRAEILTAWAKRRRWPLLEAPDPETVLAGGNGWMRDQFDDRPHWVFPHLNRCYMRHAHGLRMVRRLLDDMCAGRLGRGIAGCDSWAWAYLMRIWRGRQPTVLTAQAFDHERLERWFGVLSAGAGRRRLDFRQAKDGKYLLPPISETDQNEADSTKTGTFLKHLAACARGIPGISLAFWRKSLRLGTDNADNGAGDDEDTENEEHPSVDSTLWVTSWDEVRRPGLPSEKDPDLAFVTHALLLHDGMAADTMTEVLPVSMSRILQILSLMEEAGTAAETDGIWRITAPGYPASRQFLQEEGYLLDGF